MPIGPELLKKLQQKFEPSTTVDLRFKRFDLTIKTDENGNAILLFIGERTANGSIKGERYVRTLIHDKGGHPIKDHWELKGRAS
jgi:hypothetical protein